MTATQINAFVSWYNSCGANQPVYTISKNYNLKPFTSRKDYMPYNKIAFFEVMEY